jgi:hypothetical protein
VEEMIHDVRLVGVDQIQSRRTMDNDVEVPSFMALKERERKRDEVAIWMWEKNNNRML